MPEERVIPDDGSPPGHIEKMLGQTGNDDDQSGSEGGGDQVAQRPEDIPEQFWDAEKGEVNVAALLKSQQDGQAEISRLRQGDQQGDEQAGDESAGDETPADNQNEAIEQAGKLREKATAEFNESGDVSEETRQAIVDTGLYSRAEVDTYIAGQKAIVKDLQDAAYGPFEGKEGYEQAANWAAKNMDKETAEAIDLQLLSDNPAIVRKGAEALLREFVEKGNYEPPTLRGSGNDNSAGDVYRSRAEMMRDMSSHRYRTDSGFRNEVAQKLRRSKL